MTRKPTRSVKPRPRKRAATTTSRVSPVQNKAVSVVSIDWAVVLGLIAAVLFVFVQLRGAGFLSLDDDFNILNNPHVNTGLTLENFKWAFGIQQHFWMPLVWLSWMANVSFYGMSAGDLHMANVVVHAASSIILYGLLVRTTGLRGRSAFVAGLFAVHPLRVESVAWITEQKDTLSTLFWWLSLWAYITWVENRRWTAYAASLVLFGLGMMAKPMLVTVPVTLLLLDIWPLGRVDWSRNTSATLWRLTLEKWPFLVLAAADSFIAIAAQGTVLVTTTAVPMALRIENGFVSCGLYLSMFVWPSKLVIFYPYRFDLDPWLIGTCVVGVIGMSAVAWRLRRRVPYVAAGWFWYLATLLPVIGLFQIGNHARADRYTYVPLVGIFVIIAWGAADLWKRWRLNSLALAVVASAAFVGYAVTARVQTSYWQDSATLWRHVLDVMPDNYLALNSLGAILISEGHQEEGLSLLRRAVASNPDFTPSHYNLGLALMNAGQLREAEAELVTASKQQPNNADVRYNLALLLSVTGRTDDAVSEFRAAAY